MFIKTSTTSKDLSVSLLARELQEEYGIPSYIDEEGSYYIIEENKRKYFFLCVNNKEYTIFHNASIYIKEPKRCSIV